MLVSTLDYSSYLGRIAIGGSSGGEYGWARRSRYFLWVSLVLWGRTVRAGQGGEAVFVRRLERVEVQEASAGDIVALAGLVGVEIGKTVTAPDYLERLTGIAVEEPTISVDCKVNDSPFAGREGKYVTGRQLRDRLFRELEKNVALRWRNGRSPDVHRVGPGELHLGILMETMRREGFEFQVSRPRIIPREGRTGSGWSRTRS